MTFSRERRLSFSVLLVPSLPFAPTLTLVSSIPLSNVSSSHTILIFCVQLPSFVENSEKLKEAGVDVVACIAVNDPFVLKAWGENLKADGKVTLLSDWNASLVKHLGLDIDLSAAGLGVRSKRFSLIVDNGKITHQNVEAKPGEYVPALYPNLHISLVHPLSLLIPRPSDFLCFLSVFFFLQSFTVTGADTILGQLARASS
jgi:hypothetical protein